MIPNPDLIKFIREARRRGFDDYSIRTPLLKHGWALSEVEAAFNALKRKAREHYHFKNKVTIYLDNELLKMIEKRAKKNMLTLPEQIEDVLRRSCLSLKAKKFPAEKIDDLLVAIFSRQKRGKK
jgi:chorismate mutase